MIFKPIYDFLIPFLSPKTVVYKGKFKSLKTTEI